MQGRCTNAYYAAIVVTADIWYDRRLPCRLDVSVAAGTRATLQQLAADGNSQLWSEVATAEKSAAVSTVGFSMGYPFCD